MSGRAQPGGRQPGGAQPGGASGWPWRGQSPQERREARRRRLLDAALELFGTTGYAATSLTALCAQAGVSPRHSYELYRGREPLLADLYDEIVLETARRVAEAHAAAPLTAAERISAGLAAATAHQTDDPRRARVLHLGAVGVSAWLEQHRRRVIASFAETTAQQYRLLVDDGQLVDRPFAQVATALVGAFDELLVHWLLTEPRTPAQDLLPVAAEVFLAVFDGRAVARATSSDGCGSGPAPGALAVVHAGVGATQQPGEVLGVVGEAGRADAPAQEDR